MAFQYGNPNDVHPDSDPVQSMNPETPPTTLVATKSGLSFKDMVEVAAEHASTLLRTLSSAASEALNDTQAKESAAMAAELSSPLMRVTTSNSSFSSFASSPATDIDSAMGDALAAAAGAENHIKEDLMGSVDIESGMPLVEPQEIRPKVGLSWWGFTVYTTFLASLSFYIFARAMHTIPQGHIALYGWIVLGLECLASVSMILHGFYLLPAKVKYAPVESLRVTRHFHIRILLPCYTEALDIVKPTLLAAAAAALPKGCSRTIYLCDDGKDPVKAAWVASLALDCEVVYVCGHARVPGEVNGKSGNLNNVLSNVIYPNNSPIGLEEVVAVLDADMVIEPEFFMRTLPYLQHDKDGLVLTPQVFHNFNPRADVFGHANCIFWDVIVPGCVDGWGGVMCTGTNYIVRAKALQEIGYYPPWTLGEDVRMGVELQRLGYKGYFVNEALAVGEVPDTIRGTYMQRSRWAKGNLQNTFTTKNVLFDGGQPLMQRLLWNVASWHYLTSSIYFPMFLAVPILGILTGWWPIAFNLWFAASFTAYHLMTNAVLYFHVRRWDQVSNLWFSSLSQHLFWFSQAKACWIILSGLVSHRQTQFKTTIKTKVADVVMAEPTTAASTSKPKRAAKPSCMPAWWPAFKEMWVPLLSMVINLAALSYGLYQVVLGGVTSLPLLLSILWTVYNAVPPALLLYMALFGDTFGLQVACTLGGIVMGLCQLAVLVLIWVLQPHFHLLGDLNYQDGSAHNLQQYFRH